MLINRWKFFLNTICYSIHSDSTIWSFCIWSSLINTIYSIAFLQISWNIRINFKCYTYSIFYVKFSLFKIPCKIFKYIEMKRNWMFPQYIFSTLLTSNKFTFILFSLWHKYKRIPCKSAIWMKNEGKIALRLFSVLKCNLFYSMID